MLGLPVCALCAALAVAPSPSPSPSPSSAPADIAHVYTSDRIQTDANNTARTIYIVTREQIERNGYRTVAQALTGIPGLQISPFGPIGSSVNFTLRGSSSAQTLVLVDGLPAPGSFSNSVELGTLPVTGVERIEVVEGGGSTLYGTGAIGGVINIITAAAAQSHAALRLGSLGDRAIALETPRVQYSRIVADNGFRLPDGTTRSDLDYEASAVHASQAFRLGAIAALARAGLEADHAGTPGESGPFFSPTSREDDLNENADLTFSRTSAHAQSTLQIGATDQRIAFTCSRADANCFFPSGTLGSEGRLDAGVRNAVSVADSQVLYGVDVSRGVVRSDAGAPLGVRTSALAQTAAYVQARIGTPWGMTYAGVRGERDGGLGGEISPSVGFLTRLWNAATLKGNIATAFRAPNASELYYPGFGNPHLKPERAKVADLALTDAQIGGGVSLGWFANRTNDLIVSKPVAALGPACVVDPASFTYEPCNVDRSSIQGITLTAKTRRSNGWTLAFSGTDLYRAQDLKTGARLPNDPVMSAALDLEYAARTGALQALGVRIDMAGARSTADAQLPWFERADAYTAASAYVRVRAGSAVLLTLRASNFGNERYAAVSGYPLPGRTFAVEVSAPQR